ncbi:MAG: flavin reductase [Rhizobiaceae bacterium]|nr:flavin reductase [Rhizobiaceae bacterium]
MKNHNENFETNDRDRFLEAMSRLASAVSVVTTDGPHGRAGVTVSSLVSVSADSAKPTVMVCIHKSSSSCPVILGNGVFCANILAHHQSHIADAFAGRVRNRTGSKFDTATWSSGRFGIPRLVNSLAAVECRISDQEVVGQHHVIFAQVQNILLGGSGSPLIYSARDYATTRPLSLLSNSTAA